ncbi:T9SS C-terminal target domain-containing protein [Flavobacteriaceae bacterium]|nr:T9SS C-terminal target domain-containing protein [Flavobacteriaceae bacterium]
MKYLIISLFILISCTEPQRNSPITEDLNSFNELALVTLLDNLVDESSGLVFLNNNLITFNDSGGNNSLYEIDIANGNVIRTVNITNATNYDWEDITIDSEYIYIGDFGNNYGNRQDLLIYKISIIDFINTTDNTVSAEQINFSYSDQINFQSNPYNSNFDAESLISFNDSLYIFTKNWADRKTNIYPLTKNTGTYITSKIDSLDVQGLITAAEYNATSNTVTLLGYNTESPFIIELTNFNNSNFSQGLISKFPLVVPENSSIQTEGLANKNNSYYISAEDYLGNPQVLYQISKDSLISN